MKQPNRRSFLKFAGRSLGGGALYTAYPAALAKGEVGEPFSFVQLSDAHVRFNGPPDLLGTKAFDHAVELINARSQ